MIRILLVDDHAIVREGFKRLCEAAPDLQVIAEAGTAEEAMAAVRLHSLDVALVDISLGQQSGLQLLPALLAIAPTLKPVVVSMHEDPALVVRAMDNGAHGYITKGAAAQELLSALRRVHAGERVLSSDIAPMRPHADATRLSQRERETLRGLLSQQPPKALAIDLGISVKTLYRHRANLMEKLGARNAADLARIAQERGLLIG
ncbi:response regulator [Lysobacter olei]